VSGDTIAALVGAGAAVVGSIIAVLALAYRVGAMVGVITSFMAASEHDRLNLHAEQTRQSDRLSLHIEHHEKGTK
jgi:hypothetical protein